MPRIQAKIEGKGNGIKTVLINIADVAKALNRPPMYPTKYFGSELGAQTKCVNDRYIVNGAHDVNKLQETLDGFIQKFVLCAECGNPETDLNVVRDEVWRDCKACGKRSLADMRHKLVAFILKNPPVNVAYGVSSNGAGVAAAGKKSSESLPANDDDAEEDESVLDKKMANEAKNLPSQVTSALDDWSEVQDTLNEENDDPLEELADFIEGNPSVSDKEIINEIEALGIREDKAVAVLVQVLFNEHAISQMKKKQKLFEKLLEAEKSQKAFLGGLERLVAVAYPELMSKVPLLLKQAYDLDLLDEDVILAWGEKASKKYVSREQSKEIRKKAEPFLTWLSTAESEDESE